MNINRCFQLILAFALVLALADLGLARPTVIVVVGAHGEPEYGRQFVEWAARWQAAARQAGAEFVAIGWEAARAEPIDAAEPVDERLLLADKAGLDLLITLKREDLPANDAMWIVLIGHGTFDGKTAKFNLQGPDVSAEELANSLKNVKRPVAIINCASASGPFVNALSGENRVVLTATKSGSETNFARFGDYLSQAVGDSAADLDKDEQTSLLEAFLAATRQTSEFYKTEGRLATEHALLDDNGDALGTPADWFRGVRATRQAKDGARADGLRAHQFHLVVRSQDRDLPPALLARRDELELSVAQLRDLKPTLEEADYYERLEGLLVELAEISER